MKRLMQIMGILLLIAALLCVTVLADPAVGDTGVEPLETHSDYQVQLLDANDAVVEPNDGIYENAVKIKMTITSTDAGAFELFYLVKGDESTVPTEENLFGIDQTTGTGSAMTATLYPKELTEGTYVLIRSNNAGTSEVVMRFQVTQTANPPAPTYKLGDPDNNGTITANDAAVVLQYCVANATNKPLIISPELQPAADVDKNGSITANDAAVILQYCVANATNKPLIIPD